MVLLQDGLIAFLSAVGLTTMVWLTAGAVLHAGRSAVPGAMLVLPLRGEAPAMESDMRNLRRVRHQLPGAKIVLARPAASVRIISALTWPSPYQRVNAANAGGYSTAEWAKPATNHAT